MGSGTAFFIRGHLKTYGFYVISRFRGVKKSILWASWLLWAALGRPRPAPERPRAAQDGPGAAQEPPQERPRATQERPGATQEPPKSAQDRPTNAQEHPRAPKSAQDGPGAAQKDSQGAPGGPNSSKTTGPRHCRKRCSKIMIKRSFETASRKINETP